MERRQQSKAQKEPSSRNLDLQRINSQGTGEKPLDLSMQQSEEFKKAFQKDLQKGIKVNEDIKEAKSEIEGTKRQKEELSKATSTIERRYGDGKVKGKTNEQVLKELKEQEKKVQKQQILLEFKPSFLQTDGDKEKIEKLSDQQQKIETGKKMAKKGIEKEQEKNNLQKAMKSRSKK